MTLSTVQIEGQTVALNRAELAQVDLIRHTHAIQGAEAAAQMWLKWARSSTYPGVQIRRMAAGQALGLAKSTKTDEEHEAELARYLKLAACPMHVFDMRGVEIKAEKIPQRLTCLMCSEWLPTMEAVQYARGFAAAAGDPNTVIEGFGR